MLKFKINYLFETNKKDHSRTPQICRMDKTVIILGKTDSKIQILSTINYDKADFKNTLF